MFRSSQLFSGPRSLIPAISLDTKNGCSEGMVISRVLAVAKPRGGPELWMIGNYQGRRLLEVDPNSERAVLAPRRRTEFRRGAMLLVCGPCRVIAPMSPVAVRRPSLAASGDNSVSGMRMLASR